MSPHNHTHHTTADDRPRRRRDGAQVSAPRHSRETVGSSAIVAPASSVSAQGTTSHVRNETAPAQERVDTDRDSLGQQEKSSASPSKDKASIHSRESEGTGMRDESRPLKDEDPRRYDRDDRRDTLRGMRYPSLTENHDIHRPPLAHGKGVEPTAPSSSSFQHLYEAQSWELSVLQHERRRMLEEKQVLADAYASLEHRHEERSKKLAIVRHERQIALEQRKQIDDAYAALRLQYEEQGRKLSAVRHERQSALEEKKKAEEDCAALRQQYEAQKSEYDGLSNKYQSMRATLELRTSELQGVQRFLTTADTFSGAEVVDMLRKLNEEVQQSTTYMAEWVVENFVLEPPGIDQASTETIEQSGTSESLGVRLMQLLGTRNHKDNPILVEMAFRAYLIYSIYWVASPWSMGQEEQSHNVYIDAIYQRMRETEGQAISGNWRALTRAHTLPACISNPELAHTIDTTIIAGLSDILLAAGCTASKTDITSALWTKFADKIHHFVSLAGQVNKTIGVGVISEDFEVLVVWPDATFDERQMEDAYDSGERVQGTEGRQEVVLCATDLGLMQRMMVGGGGEERKSSEIIVIKPKVALVSVLDFIDGY